MKSLTGKVALVTGASRGIGAAVAKHLADCGASVVMGSRSQDLLQENCQQILLAGGKAESVKCDVTQYSDLQAAVALCIDKFGSIDVLVNNAGTVDPLARISDADPELWSEAIDTNVKGVFYSMRAALPVMEKQGFGTIVNMSSGAANSALEGWSHYCSSKAAVKKLTECAHVEMSAKGIRVVGLSPGTVATNMMAKIRDSKINPVSRLDWSAHISVEWVARAIEFLCLPDSDEFLGTDFSIKTEEGKKLVGLI